MKNIDLSEFENEYSSLQLQKDVIDLQKGMITMLQTQSQLLERLLMLELAAKKHFSNTEAHKY